MERYDKLHKNVNSVNWDFFRSLTTETLQFEGIKLKYGINCIYRYVQNAVYQSKLYTYVANSY